MLKVYTNGSGDHCELIRGIDDINRVLQNPDIVLWIDIERPERELMEDLARIFRLDAESIEDCLAGADRTRIDEFDDHLFFLLYGAVNLKDPPRFDPRKLCIFYGKRFLITVHDEPLRSISATHSRGSRHLAELLDRGVDFLLYTLIDGIVDNYVLCAESYEETLDELEERSLTGAVDNRLLAELSDQRWELIEFRRLIMALREVVTPLCHGASRHFAADLELRFNHIWVHLTHTMELVEGLRELTHGIRDNYYANIAERTGKMMRTLTLFSTFMLPLTLITGVYGMNIHLWPPGDLIVTPFFVASLMATVTGLLYIYFRKRGWL